MPLPRTLTNSMGSPITLSPVPQLLRSASTSPNLGGVPTAWSLGVNMQPQVQTNWCWAATSSSVHRFYQNASSAWSQCDVANAELTQTACCVNGSTPQCNQAWYLDRALTRVGHFRSMSSGVVAVVALNTELIGNRPVCCRVGWSGGGGHFLAIDGLDISGTTMLTVQDPIYGTSSMDYATCQRRPENLLNQPV